MTTTSLADPVEFSYQERNNTRHSINHSAPQSPCARNLIRKQIRELRRSLSADSQVIGAKNAAILMLDELKGCNKVALYIENDGEISTRPLIEALWKNGVEVFVPVLHPFCPGHLLFTRYETSTPMQPNMFGIPEPALACHQLCPAERLDAIITPLVAFDSKGNRLGMGGGFYDRTLAHLSHAIKLIGLAHDCQQLPTLPIETWDVPLPCIVTPSTVIRRA